MCGIAGFVQRSDKDAGAPILSAMLKRIEHRGPDGSGQWEKKTDSGWTVRLGHRRLSIIDLERGGQPLGNHDGTIQITFNGEIFNFLDLRPRLVDEGYRFSTHSDTEVLLHHLSSRAESPLRGLDELNAMFAFAYWNEKRQELLIARDHAGIKPLYFAPLANGGLAFASELTSLIQHPLVCREMSINSLASFFFSDYVQPPETILSGVFKLLPGHFFTWRAGELSQPKPFWKLASKEIEKDTNESSLEEKLWRHLENAVERQLIADVPVGVFLSGGIDSSIVATLAQKLRGKNPIKTFTIAFEDKDYDESQYAKMVAEKLGTEHIVETLSEQAMMETLDEALNSLDEPMGDPSILPTYCLSRLAARHVKVVLGGDGGDELWAGYPTYKAQEWAKAYQVIPPPFHRGLIRPSVSKLPLNLRYQSFEWKAKRFIQRWDKDKYRRHLRWMSATDLPLVQGLFPGLKIEPSVFQNAKPLFADSGNSLLALDFSTYMPGSVLTKVDRASMARGLEVRPPFLDTQVIRWSFSVPYEWKRRNGTGKYLLKGAARGKLPESILHRSKKGFGIPLARWLQKPLLERLRSSWKHSALWDCPGVSRDCFQQSYVRFMEQREDHSKTLWAFLVLDHWMNKEKIHRVRND